ncbi:unnamed protein product [Amaranthus hypochondriacus]
MAENKSFIPLMLLLLVIWSSTESRTAYGYNLQKLGELISENGVGPRCNIHIEGCTKDLCRSKCPPLAYNSYCIYNMCCCAA